MIFDIRYTTYNKIDEMETLHTRILEATGKDQVVEYLLSSGIIELSDSFYINEIIPEDITHVSSKMVYSFTDKLNNISNIKLHANKTGEYYNIKALNDIRKKLTLKEIELLGL